MKKKPIDATSSFNFLKWNSKVVPYGTLKNKPSKENYKKIVKLNNRLTIKALEKRKRFALILRD